MDNFVHLHLHSEYSLLDGACRIADIPKAAKKQGQSAVALTDHGVMYGVVDFYKACKEEGIKPIIGCEVYLAPSSRFNRDPGYSHLTLLVKNEVGYKNLTKLVSLGFTEGFYAKPRIDFQLLEQYSEGLVCLSGCLFGRVSQCLLNDNYQEARNTAMKFKNIFEDDFYLEIQNHGLDEQKKITPQIATIANELNIQLVATNDVHYIEKKDAETQAILMCIQTGKTIDEGRPKSFDCDELYLKSYAEMCELFKDYPDSIKNTEIIAEKCNFDFEFNKKHLPRFPLPEGQKAQNVLRELAQSGLERKIQSHEIDVDGEADADEYKSRMTYELFIINHMGYDEYFLIVYDFVNYAKSHNIPVGPGRGSGAGSLVAYLIGITEVDPIKYNLLFERFLNPERVSMPDFDIDFCYERRDQVIKYVTEKYGEDHVSQIVTFGTLAARAAVRDVGKALGYPYSFVDKVVSFIPRVSGISIKSVLVDDLKKLYDSDDDVKKLIDISMAVEGMPRHSSTHAAGVVITEEPISEYMPVAISSSCVVTQFDMDTVAELGLLKFDFLALRFLTIIDNCEKLIRRKEPSFNIANIDLSDTATYEMISEGTTNGIFQLESAGMKRLLRSFRPSRIEDIMIALALYRPGPMDSIPAFIENRKKKKIEYKIPQLEEILSETSGCIVYQEQVMQIFRKVANYSYGKADVIRRIMAKKKVGEIEKERIGFVEGAKRNFIDEKLSNELFDEMVSFASYAFNKSHAAAYSIVAYRTAYLKCHYFNEYFASLLSSVMGDLTQASEYLIECEKNKSKILSPDINKSHEYFSVENDGIRFPLLAIKGVGVNIVKDIINNREEEGEYRSFIDFVSRIPLSEMSKRSIESFIKVGCFDSFGINRQQLILSMDDIIDKKIKKNYGGVEGQMDLFASEEEDTFDYPNVEDYELRSKIAIEKELCQYSFSGHLIDYYSKEINACENLTKISSINQLSDGDKVLVIGIVNKVNEKTTKNGGRMAFVTIEDKYSEVELVVFPTVFEQSSSILSLDAAIKVVGKISQRDDGKINIIADGLCLVPNNDISHAVAKKEEKPNHALYLRVENENCDSFKKAMNIVEIFEGETEVFIYNSQEKKYKKTGFLIEADDFVLNELSGILGKENVVNK